MLDSPPTPKLRIFSTGRSKVFLFLFFSFFVLVSIFSISILPPYDHVLLFRFFSSSTTRSPQFSREPDAFSGKNASERTMLKSSNDDRISEKSNGFSRKAAPPNGTSSNHGFSSAETRSGSSGGDQVFKNINGYYSRKVRPILANVTGKIEALDISRNSGMKGSIGSSSNYDYSFAKTRTNSSDDARVSKKTKGFSRKVKPIVANVTEKIEALNFSRNPAMKGSIASLNYDSSSARTRINSSNDAQVFKKPKGYSRKVNVTEKIEEALNISRNSGTKGSTRSSSDYDFSSTKTRTNSPNDARVSKKTNGYSRKVKTQKSQALNVSRNPGIKGSVIEEKGTVHKGIEKKKKKKKGKHHSLDQINLCRFSSGKWVKDNRHPLYEPGSCPFIDESFDCYRNGKPENVYERYRWQPEGCEMPRWNGKKMLRLLAGKRLVYVGDSLNRNMWESMVCMLRNSVRNKSNVYEASHKQEFRSEGSYSFVFRDYDFSVEFFRSTFLVQEWEMRDKNGSTKETLRLDLVDQASDLYRDADVLVFNTGHWWTHEKTAAGKGYYQEGDHVYDQLDVMEALKKAMRTWTKWINSKVDPRKTLVFFRGYSSSHFRGGQWNSGGQCDSETEPIEHDRDLPHNNNRVIMEAAETVLTKTKAPIFYLNVTRMSEFRKDAHPSIYLKPNMTDEERRTETKFQDCSHWCLPGVPDTWNEIVYSQILKRYHRNR